MRSATGLLWFCLGSVCGCSQYDTTSPNSPTNSGAPAHVMAWPKDWSKHLGQTVTVDGTAENHKIGAFLVSKGEGGIYIDGLHSWPEGFYSGGDQGKRLRVTGTVIKKDDVPVFVPKPGQPVPCGVPVESEEELESAKWRYLLTGATWTVLE
jgi:hypothetical protein